ncbi:PRC-barrel domain-containing protein [Pseudalkalibacillus caeni]|uniref:PRC-barrel domain-containing protein n=1 Tax=Exobacillus caeni TaxID=2574798 RepID=UPI00148519AD|nr:PRC-barrel domain-containing protein [Pseudalkalibacillus caeni]
MRTFSALKGLPVYEKNAAGQIGKVIDLIIANQTIHGLLVDWKGFLRGHQIIPIEAICSIGEDGIILHQAEPCVPFFHRKKDWNTMCHRQCAIKGKPLLKQNGQKMGLVEDVYFEEESGRMLGIIVTDGWFSDITEGQKQIDVTTNLTIGKDALLVE